jgi:hypothetical protein
MGRELKRVPMDFDWPLRKPYVGYINPLYTAVQCEYCESSGASPRAKELCDQWYGKVPFKPEDNGSVPFTSDNPIIVEFASRNGSIEFYAGQFGYSKETAISYEAKRLTDMWNTQLMHHLNDTDVAALIAAGRLKDFTHTWVKGDGWVKKDPEFIPTAKQINEWSLTGFSHDSSNQWVVVQAKCKAEGLPDTCANCDGEGEIWPSKEEKEKYETWEKTDPPKGEGYQMWETTSEGSPISPVFSTAEKLAYYLMDIGIDKDTTYGAWLKFIKAEGSSFDLVVKDGNIMTGVEAYYYVDIDNTLSL